MTSVQNDTARIYSADKKIWLGMTSKDAYKNKELLKIFNYANKNSSDDVIDEDELRRYNGSSLVVEKNSKEF